MKIGIAITVHNRNETAKITIDKIKSLSPKNSVIVIVDDASEIPYDGADYRFKSNAGIAGAKNKCIELLYDKGCTHFFLFDDDVYPLVKDWHLKYINTGINHLCFSFDKFINGRPNGRKINSQFNGLVEYHEPCGCMLYLTRECVDKVGGMDPEFGKWGFEHVGYSMRIHNAGLTPKPFLDIKNSTDVLYSLDWDQTIKRSVSASDRSKHIPKNQAKYKSEIKSSKYIDFREPKNCIITTFFTTLGDTQRNGEKWGEEMRMQIKPLQDSCDKFGIELIILDDNVNITPKHPNPYFARWIAIADFLNDNKQYKNVWCVDATDVEVLRNPFKTMQDGKLYVGSEPSFTNTNVWLKNHHKHELFDKIFRERIVLKNAGILGGDRERVLSFCTAMEIITEKVSDTCLTDMALFNWVANTVKTEFGPKVNTEFKKYRDNGVAWFKHK